MYVQCSLFSAGAVFLRVLPGGISRAVSGAAPEVNHHGDDMVQVNEPEDQPSHAPCWIQPTSLTPSQMHTLTLSHTHSLTPSPVSYTHLRAHRD